MNIKAQTKWLVAEKLEPSKENINGFIVDKTPEKKAKVLSFGDSFGEMLKEGDIIIYKEAVQLEERRVAVEFDNVIAIIK